MKKISLFLAYSMAIACGDDDRPGPDDVTTDMTVRDLGPGTDLGPPPDLGPPVDMGGGGDDDMGTTPSMCSSPGDCDIQSNEGCEAGDGCYLTMDGSQCLAAGTKGDLETCGAAADCREGFVCLVSDGLCHRICCMAAGDEDCNPTDTGQLCAIGLNDVEGYGACTLPDDCDPVAQTGCAGDEACYPIGSDGVFQCTAPGDAGGQGADCSSARCNPGFLCIGNPAGEDEPPICAELCARPDGSCDTADHVCNPLGGYDDIGACVPL